MFKNMHAAKTQEQRSLHGKMARSRVTHSKEGVQKQWATIKSDPESFAKARVRLKQTADTFWAGMSPEDRNQHFQKVFANSSRGRSHVGNGFISALAEAGVLLASEQPVQGFIVDGLDAEHHLIVEFYGDIYHCNPKKITDPEQVCPWLGRTVAQQ